MFLWSLRTDRQAKRFECRIRLIVSVSMPAAVYANDLREILCFIANVNLMDKL